MGDNNKDFCQGRNKDRNSPWCRKSGSTPRMEPKQELKIARDTTSNIKEKAISQNKANQGHAKQRKGHYRGGRKGKKSLSCKINKHTSLRGPTQGLGNVEAQIANTQKLAISRRKDKQKDILERDDHFYKLYCWRRDKMTRFIASRTMIGTGVGKF